jgi:hypothetical protein
MEFLRSTRIAAIGILLTILTTPLGAIPATQTEYALKSVFVYNFCRFIDWPDSAFASPSEPLVIGIVGDDPFGPLLNEAIAGETYHGRPIQIEHYRSPREIKRCHLLFVSRSESPRLDSVLSAVAGKSIVTIGETDDFIDQGGMIALTPERNRIRLRINAAALRAARLDVSSKLLRVADVTS